MATEFRRTQASGWCPQGLGTLAQRCELGLGLRRELPRSLRGILGLKPEPPAPRPVLSAQGDCPRTPRRVADGLASVLSDSEQQELTLLTQAPLLAAGWEGGSRRVGVSVALPKTHQGYRHQQLSVSPPQARAGPQAQDPQSLAQSLTH